MWLLGFHCWEERHQHINCLVLWLCSKVGDRRAKRQTTLSVLFWDGLAVCLRLASSFIFLPLLPQCWEVTATAHGRSRGKAEAGVWGSWPYCIHSQEAGKRSSTHHLPSFSPGLQLTHIQGPSSDIWQHFHEPTQRKVPRSLQLLSKWQWSLTMWGKSSHMKSGSETERILQTAEILVSWLRVVHRLGLLRMRSELKGGTFQWRQCHWLINGGLPCCWDKIPWPKQLTEEEVYAGLQIQRVKSLPWLGNMAALKGTEARSWGLSSLPWIWRRRKESGSGLRLLVSQRKPGDALPKAPSTIG